MRTLLLNVDIMAFVPNFLERVGRFANEEILGLLLNFSFLVLLENKVGAERKKIMVFITML